MKIAYGEQIEINKLNDKKFDVFILGGNHEGRVCTAYNEISKVNTVEKAIMFCYSDSFKCRKKEIITKYIESQEQIFDILDSVVLNTDDRQEINIFIDYSCMTKYWYYSIIMYLANKDIALQRINAYFGYTPSKYSAPQKPKPNSEIAPLPGKYIIPTDKPKALIVCLGYEQNKAEGIINHLDPKCVYIFYTKPALDERFVSTLEKNNKNVLTEFDKGKIITYPFDDLLYLERQLTAIYFLLKDEYSIIIAPLGPKPFTLVSMLMSVRYSDIDIWRVGSGSDINEYSRKPIENKFIITEVVFTN
jgi:hypothetical protein